MLTDLSGGDLFVVLVSIVLALTTHEAMHGYMAHWLGDDTAHHEGRLTLNPLAHIDTLTTILLPLILILLHVPPILAAKPVPFNPERLKYDEFGAALVAIAGPLTNLVLAGIAAVIFRAWGPELSSTINNAIIIFTSVNVGFLVFNMLPIPPLDGSRVLYAFAPDEVREIMDRIEAMGFMFLLVVLLVGYQFIGGFLGNIMDSVLRFLLV